MTPMQQMFLGLGAADSYKWNGDRAIGGGGRNASGADINNIAYFSIFPKLTFGFVKLF